MTERPLKSHASTILTSLLLGDLGLAEITPENLAG